MYPHEEKFPFEKKKNGESFSRHEREIEREFFISVVFLSQQKGVGWQKKEQQLS